MVKACDEYTLPGGRIVDSSGTYRDTLTTPQGCDSIVITELAISSSSPVTDERVTECNRYTWPANGVTYDQSGIYTATLINATGCYSVIRLNLTLTELLFEVIPSDGFFTAVIPEGGELQWLDCDNDFAPVAGATGSTFAPPDSRAYALEVTADGCVDTSDCQSLVPVGVNETAFEGKLSLFPNPTTGRITVGLGKTYGEVRTILRNSSGQSLAETRFERIEQFDLQVEGPAGVYTLEIRTQKGERAVVRLLKE